MVTAAGIRASESCNTLLEIVGFTASDACDFMFRFFIMREMAQKLSNQLEKEIFPPKLKVLLLLRCCEVASRSTFTMPFVSRFCLQILKEKTKTIPLR